MVFSNVIVDVTVPRRSSVFSQSSVQISAGLTEDRRNMKILLNVNKNARILIECELHANVRFLAIMNASSRYWSSIHTNESVFSRNEQQEVYLGKPYAREF